MKSDAKLIVEQLLPMFSTINIVLWCFWETQPPKWTTN